MTEHSSTENKKTSVSSSEDFPAEQGQGYQVARDIRITSKTSWRSKVSASDEGIEDINEECSSLSSQLCLSTLQLSNMYKVTTPSIDSGHQENISPPGAGQLETRKLMIFNYFYPDNPVFPETEKLIARCIGRSGPSETEDGASSDISELASLKLPGGESDLLMPAAVSTCPSPASSEGGIYTSVIVLSSPPLSLHLLLTLSLSLQEPAMAQGSP